MTDVEPADYRAVAARLAAGVVVVTAVRHGVAHAATVSSVASVSLDPPMLLFCVHVDARLRDVLDGTDAWAVSVLADGQADVADWLASPGRPAVGQLDRVAHVAAPVSGAPWLDGAAAWFDCRTEAVYGAGDHDVVIGRVVAAREGAPDAGGLVHLRGRLRGVR
ncbi:flavin reductase family protein [Cellulomonas iranensis]|uniref:flavin reductase family protein n=1 Tax=Cellulomonas iranensis TaxID=76862 RepID=UPI001CF2D632|nr:flavin reductase family protein [Cellulomonas iranensis]UCN13886.1 flavin reductase family protein [Cellulomonas iranensis]